MIDDHRPDADDGTAPGDHTAVRRPLGLSAGAISLVASWFAAGAIARLTGAPSIIAMMAVLFVTMIVDALTGWIETGRCGLHAVMGPSMVDVGADARLRVELRPGRRPCRVVVSDGQGVVGSADVADPGASHDRVVTARFSTPGVVTDLRVTVEVVGAFGLFWWRRSTTMTIEPIYVAPRPAGAHLDVERTPAELAGEAPAARGAHLGDVDGVRPWREGEPIGAVHWPSSLRAGSLIVHDRSVASEQRWEIDLDALTASSAAQLRSTLDEGLRQGHAVSVTVDGASHDVIGEPNAARWAAEVASRDDALTEQPPRIPLLRRPIRWRRHSVETHTSINSSARWAAAAAALLALSTLVGALGWSARLILMLAGAIALGAAVSLRIARRSGSRPVMLQVAMVVAVIGALAAITLDARDVDGLVDALRGPMPNLLMLLVVLHGFEVVDRRTLRAHQAITFVVAAYGAGLRLDDELGWWLGSCAIALLTSLWLTPRSPRRHRRANDRRSTRASLGSAIRPVAWIGGSIVAALALLSVVPIPDGPARLGLPALSNNAPSAAPGALAAPDGSPMPPRSGSVGDNRGAIGDVVGYPGFTETLDTSVRGDLGDEIVMRVRAPEPAFWRGQTFADFDGRTWSVSPAEGRRQDGPVIDVAPTLGEATGASVDSEELVQTYYVETDLPNVVFAAPRPTRVVFDGALWTRPDGALRSDVTLTAGSVYTVVSDRIQVTPESLRAQGDVGPLFDSFRETPGGSQVDPFLALPDSTTQRTIDLADELRTPGESTYDTILAYQAWLSANTEYDLDAPVPDDGADAVDDFLFESRLGFCEQIASTLAVMLRSQGVPARLATGYVSGERDRVSGVWKVKASDAHAWVEVWFPESGWQPFDPTASVPLAGETDAGTVGGDLIGAAAASALSLRVELVLVALGAMALWVSLVALRSLRRRRRRGRWGLLQDRFAAIAAPSGATTNPMLAAALRERAANHSDAGIGLIADTLDRVAFDPTWTDDDDAYERTRRAVVTLERSTR